MRGASSKDIHCVFSYGDIRVMMVAEGCSWSPDVARDIVNRTADAWHACLESLYEFGLVEQPSEDYEEEEDDSIIEVDVNELFNHLMKMENEDG